MRYLEKNGDIFFGETITCPICLNDRARIERQPEGQNVLVIFQKCACCEETSKILITAKEESDEVISFQLRMDCEICGKYFSAFFLFAGEEFKIITFPHTEAEYLTEEFHEHEEQGEGVKSCKR